MIEAKNIKYWIIGIIVVLIIVGLLIFKPSFSRKTPFDKQVLDGVTLTHISIENENNIYTYRATVKATKDMNINYIKIIVTKNNKKYELVGYVGKELPNGETAYITSSTDENISNPEKIEYVIINN